MKTAVFRIVIEPSDNGFQAVCPALRNQGAWVEAPTPTEALIKVKQILHLIVQDGGRLFGMPTIR